MTSAPATRATSGSGAAPPTAPPPLGLGGTLEIGGESANALIPYNVNSQSVRQRFWDGQDKMIKDDVTWIKRNHLIQFGGMYQRNYDYHMRTDNGQGINNAIVYQSTSSNINFGELRLSDGYLARGPGARHHRQPGHCSTPTTPTSWALSPNRSWSTPAPARTCKLGKIGDVATDQSIIPSYNLYVSDTWHLQPSVTLTYGISYELQMPPYELQRQAGFPGRYRRQADRCPGLPGRAPEGRAGRTGLPADSRLRHHQQHQGPQVPVRHLLRRHHAARVGRLESQIQRRTARRTGRREQDRHPRRLRPHLRPPQRRQPATGAAAASGPAAGRLLRRRQPHRRLPAAPTASTPPPRSASARTATTLLCPGFADPAAALLPGRQRRRGRQRRQLARPQVPARTHRQRHA